MRAGPAEEFFKSLNSSEFRLARPRRFVLLCGGVRNEHAVRPPSARESFLRCLPDRASFDEYGIILAEDVDVFYPDSPYGDLIHFEIDIARISDSVILFSEGYGSLAELGAFSQITAIAERMVVIIQAIHHAEKSFIRDGPIRQLEKRDGKSVQVFDWRTTYEGGLLVLDEQSFKRHVDDIKEAIRGRLAGMPAKLKFDAEDFGHKILLAVAICDALGAATFEDIKVGFRHLDVPLRDDEVTRALFCAKTVGWLIVEQNGNTKYYLPRFTAQPCDFAYRPGVVQKDTIRWKRDIRAHWKENDRRRARLIDAHPRMGSPND